MYQGSLWSGKRHKGTWQSLCALARTLIHDINTSKGRPNKIRRRPTPVVFVCYRTRIQLARDGDGEDGKVDNHVSKMEDFYLILSEA
jgi:hypothetical protein